MSRYHAGMRWAAFDAGDTRRWLVAIASVGMCLAPASCAKGPGETCWKLVECSEALRPGTGAALGAAYGPKGACYRDSAAAQACSKSCEKMMAALRAMPNFAATDACR